MSLKCLIVEDNNILRNTISLCASRLALQVYQASTGEAALRMLKTNRIDILVTDCDLGSGLGGVALARHTLKVHPAAKIMFITAKSEIELRDAAKVVQPCVILNKPFSLAAFRDTLIKVCAEIDSQQS